MATSYRQIIAVISTLIIACSASVAFSQSEVAAEKRIVGTVVRFAAGSSSVELTIGEDNSTVRDFLSMLPLTMKLEEFAGREKIGYFSRKLKTEGSPGSDPEDGDLIYFVPWGNIGFYYDASGIGYSDQTIHIGKYKASREQLEELEGKPVSVEIVR